MCWIAGHGSLERSRCASDDGGSVRRQRPEKDEGCMRVKHSKIFAGCACAGMMTYDKKLFEKSTVALFRATVFTHNVPSNQFTF